MQRKTFVSNYIPFVTGLLLAPDIAHAQDVNPVNVAMAQKLYDEAIMAIDAHDHAAACPKLEKVTQLIPRGVGGHSALGECYEALGRVGSAWQEYTTCQTLAVATGDSKRSIDCAKKAKALMPKLAKITIKVPKTTSGLPGLSISKDGRVQEKALWDMPLPVDTGEHVIEVQAPGRQTWKKTVTILAEGADVSVDVPSLSPIPSPDPPNAQTMPTMAPKPLQRPWQRPLGWAFIGIGAANLVGTGVLAGVAKQLDGASQGHCDANNVCDEMGHSLQTQAMGLAKVATVTTVIGAVFVAGGAVVSLTAPSKPKDVARRETRIRWGVDFSPTGVGLRGVW